MNDRLVVEGYFWLAGPSIDRMNLFLTEQNQTTPIKGKLKDKILQFISPKGKGMDFNKSGDLVSKHRYRMIIEEVK